MFLRICTDEQMNTYVSHVDSGRINLATVYASRLVTKKFFDMIRDEEVRNGNA